MITTNETGKSVFTKVTHPLSNHGGMYISERQQALNFRHRKSAVGYKSDWHTAGDPTLILVMQGQITLELRSGESKTFTSGQQFIAADYTLETADESITGHRAYVEGEIDLQAVHIKLSQRSN
ncbi:hypothetical protein EYS14_14535 [Alteromonadaceae bacterium M269]|nr:hypothetical protein EYS14_14535 [Alteromonadaceae bacterium M269]